MKVDGKVLVVTGAANGIGREVALELVRRGAAVVAADRDEAGLAETVTLAPEGRITTTPLDVTDRAATSALPSVAVGAHGRVDGVVNVAGIIQPFVRLAELDVEVIRRVVDVNLWGTINVTTALLPALLERPEAHVANVSSMGGYLPVPGQTAYGASKAAVKLLTEGLYAELLRTNVGVSVVMPGAVATEITKNSGVEISAPSGGRTPRTTSAREAGRIIVDGIEDDRLHVFVGRDAKLMNLLTRVAPKRSIHLIQRQMRQLLG